MMSTSRTVRSAALGTAAAVVCLLSACSSTSNNAAGAGSLAGATPTGTTVASSAPAAPVTATATVTATPAPPTYYFGNGKTYDAWIIKVSGNTLTLALVHHLTGDDAKNYLTSHGQTVGPDGVPDDYINVDTHVHKTVQLSASAKTTTNEEGAGPAPLSVSAFEAWLATNPVKPVATADQDAYPGAPTFFGPLFAVTFTNDVMVSANQVFEP